MSAAYLGMTTASDHDVTLTITGDVESLRPRLLDAVQKLGYTVLGEQPIYAKRGAQCGARYNCSFEAIDYPTRLTISLKQINDIAVVATFSYEIKSYKHIANGDRQTLQLEAEAISALASQRFSRSACPACATPVTDDSHFCRRCGAPLEVEVAELEVLRLTRKSRAAFHNLVIGVLLTLVAAVLMLPMIWVEPKLFKILLMLASTAGLLAIMTLSQGLWQLNSTLNPKPSQDMKVLPGTTVRSRATQALPDARELLTVTEGTTELLVPAPRRDDRSPEPLAKVLDTGEVDDRLM